MFAKVKIGPKNMEQYLLFAFYFANTPYGKNVALRSEKKEILLIFLVFTKEN